MSVDQRFEELRARVSLTQGTATLLLLVAPSEAAIDASRRLVVELLRAAPMSVADLGPVGHDMGPARWVERTQSQSADAYVLAASPKGPLSAKAFAGLLNAEREFLRQLAGPVLLVISRETERVLRDRAPDFVTWAAQSYALPDPSVFAAIARRLGAAEAALDASIVDEPPIRFLHLSDIHLRPERVKRFDQDKVLRGLMDFLARDRERFPLDIVFFTGDLAHSGKPEEYALVVEFFGQLLETTGVLAERLFVVPGNHDVDRDVGRWLLRTLPDSRSSDTFFLKAESRRLHAHKFEAYRMAMSPLLSPCRPLGLGVGKDAVEIVEIGGARLAVASFNTAWFAQGDDARGKLWLGDANVAEAADRIADEGAGFAIALMHHPFEDLDENERDIVESRIERSFDLVLRGHLHKNKTRAIGSQRGGFVEVAGPAAYQGSRWPNGCFLGEIRPKARSVRLFPYQFASGADPWVLDPTVFPDDAEEGYARTFRVPEKKIPKGFIRKAFERTAEETVRAASWPAQRQMAAEFGLPEVKGETREVMVRHLARKAISESEDPALWADVGQANKLGQAIAEEASKEIVPALEDEARIQRTDPKFLETALLRAAQIFRDHDPLDELRSQVVRGRALAEIFTRILREIVDGPIVLVGSRGVPALLIGKSTDPAENRAAIVFNVGPRMLDLYLESSGAAHGAVVVVSVVGATEGAPELEHVKTPQGREVLLLRL